MKNRGINTLSELKDYIIHLEDIERYYMEVTQRITEVYQKHFQDDFLSKQ